MLFSAPARMLALPLFVAAALAVPATAQTTPLGPTPYVSFANSPFNGVAFQWFILLTAEPGAETHAGVSILNSNGGAAIVAAGSLVDSVDADDGVTDGSGANGHSYFACPSFIDVRFDSSILGSLPTHAGIVWTDGMGLVTVNAYNGNGVLIGTVTGNSADGNYNSGTAEDRFYGFISSAGIARLTIADQNGCIEVDHIQAGRASGPIACGPADIGRSGGLAGSDGVLDNNDFIAFINDFFGASPLADRGVAGGLPGHDGHFDNNDFIVFINQFFAGCT
jgi:hypothetical protein